MAEPADSPTRPTAADEAEDTVVGDLAPRAALGRAVPPAGLPSSPALRLVDLPVAAVAANRRQPRTVFDDDALGELRASIAEVGLLQPIVVREWPRGGSPVVDEPGGTVTHELIAGERRLRCVRDLGWDTVPALVRVTQDEDLLRDALVENLQRSALNPLEEAAAYEALLSDFSWTHEELARSVGRSRPHITNTLRLLRLPAAVQRRVASGVLSPGHARALLGLPSSSAMESMASRIVAEGLSVRTVEELVALGVTEDGGRQRRPAPRRSPTDLTEVGQALSDRLETRVKVSMGRAKGKVTIEFAGREDLERILGILTDGTRP